MSMLMASVVYLHCSMQEEDILKHTILTPSVICVHCNQLEDHCVFKKLHLITLLSMLMTRY